MEKIKNTMAIKLRVLMRKYWIVNTTLAFILSFCFLVGGVFDIDRGSTMIHIMTTRPVTDNNLLLAFGLFFVVCFIAEICMAIVRSDSKWIMAWRLFVSFFIPAHIIYNILYLQIELFSADSLLFVIIPIGEFALFTIARIKPEKFDYDSYLEYDRKNDYE